MINYHPDPELLIDYAAGSLSLAQSLSIATHIEHCEECRKQVAKLELVGSNLFDAQPKLLNSQHKLDTLKFDLLNRLDELTEDEAKQDEVKKQAIKRNSRIPRALQQFVPDSYDELNWMRLSSALQVATLCNDADGRQVALTRVRAGCSIPVHTHAGHETTLVLEGSFSDESGIYRRGDFICRDQKDKHKPVVTKDAECICLTILDAPIQFTGFFTRWLNPILRRYHPDALS